MHLEFPAANLGPAMGSLVRENQPTTLCLVDSDSRRRSQRPSRRLSTRRRPRGFGLACLGNNGTARLKRRPRRLLARLSNSCDVLNLRQAGLGTSHQGLIAATCRQSFRQQGSFGISRYTAAPLVWNLRDPTGVLDEAPLENGRRLCCVTRDGGVTPRTERCVLDRKPDA